MRILYVGTLPPHPGGAAISCAQILAGLMARGHSVAAIAPVTPTTVEGARAFAVAHPALDVTRYPVAYSDHESAAVLTGDYRDAVSEQLRTRVQQAIVASRPDVMLVGKETFAWTAPEVARAHGVPAVQRLVGTVTYKLLEGSYPETVAAELRAKLAAIDGFVTPSRDLAGAVPRLGLDRVRVIPTAIDLEQFHPAPRDPRMAARYGIAADDVVVAHLSNLKPVKRALDMVSSAALALPRDRRLLYLVIGDGSGRAELERASRELTLGDRVRFTGWLPYEEMPAHVRLADLVVMPSASEGLARAYVETQASGRVLIASDIPAARQVIVDGESGLLFRRGDIEALADVTLRAAADPALRARLGRNARDVAEHHALEGAVDAYEALLSDVARRRGRGAPVSR
jgi:glycosyltransferase involved in cell wall biosynthesis